MWFFLCGSGERRAKSLELRAESGWEGIFEQEVNAQCVAQLAGVFTGNDRREWQRNEGGAEGRGGDLNH